MLGFDNTVYLFTLFSEACAIADTTTDTVVITGGSYPGDGHLVKRYNTNGYMEDLAPLKEKRWNHGCGSYQKGGTQVK